MSERESVEGSAQNTQLCWVHTKWGRHQAQVLIEVIDGNNHYVMVRMINDAFKLEQEIQKFNKDQIEYI